MNFFYVNLPNSCLNGFVLRVIIQSDAKSPTTTCVCHYGKVPFKQCVPSYWPRIAAYTRCTGPLCTSPLNFHYGSSFKKINFQSQLDQTCDGNV